MKNGILWVSLRILFGGWWDWWRVGGKVGLIGSFVESVNVASRGWRL